jgi:hypothetical protein
MHACQPPPFHLISTQRSAAHVKSSAAVLLRCGCCGYECRRWQSPVLCRIPPTLDLLYTTSRLQRHLNCLLSFSCYAKLYYAMLCYTMPCWSVNRKECRLRYLEVKCTSTLQAEAPALSCSILLYSVPLGHLTCLHACLSCSCIESVAQHSAAQYVKVHHSECGQGTPSQCSTPKQTAERPD